MAKINIEGNATIGINVIYCVCKCGHHENENAIVEFNFRDEKVYFRCPKCKKNNEMAFGSNLSPNMGNVPMPRTRIG